MRKFPILLLLLCLMGSAHCLIGYGESNVFSIFTQTVPVELSSFTALVSSAGFVSINWTSQSEAGLIGYRVFRATSVDLAAALLITPVCIPATNTSQPHSYVCEDHEVESGCCYNYWLESVDCLGSNYYGPVSVAVGEDPTPPLPEVTRMRSTYPNPFVTSTNLEIDVKAEETAILGIYSLAGRLVRSESLTPGSHKLVWNGLDAQGRPCASGIYLIRLSSPSCVASARLALIK